MSLGREAWGRLFGGVSALLLARLALGVLGGSGERDMAGPTSGVPAALA